MQFEKYWAWAHDLIPRACMRVHGRWLAMERVLKGIVGISAALLADLELAPDVSSAPSSYNLRNKFGPALFLSVSLIVLFAHLFLLRQWHPTCTVTFVTRVRTVLLLIAGYGQIITLAMLFMPWDGWLRVLLVSWTFAGAGFICYAIYLLCCKRVTKRVRASIAAAARAKEERQQARQSWTYPSGPQADPQGYPPPPPPLMPPPPLPPPPAYY